MNKIANKLVRNKNLSRSILRYFRKAVFSGKSLNINSFFLIIKIIYHFLKS